MAHPIVAKWRSFLPHGFLEQTGVLVWIIGVLVIGLRCFLVVVEQPAFVQMIRFGVTLLYGSAFVIAVGGISVTCVVWLRGTFVRAQMPGTASLGRISLARWLARVAALVIECLLAATVLQMGVRWAAQAALPWTTLGLLTGTAALHILLAVYHEHVNARTRRW